MLQQISSRSVTWRPHLMTSRIQESGLVVDAIASRSLQNCRRWLKARARERGWRQGPHYSEQGHDRFGPTEEKSAALV